MWTITFIKTKWFVDDNCLTLNVAYSSLFMLLSPYFLYTWGPPVVKDGTKSPKLVMAFLQRKKNNTSSEKMKPPLWPHRSVRTDSRFSESYLLFELHWMLNVHRVQETNTNTHTKNKNILLAASSAIVGTLMSFCYCSYRVQDAPKNLAFDRTKKKKL